MECLRSAGIEIERVKESSAGRSAWIRDPEGRLNELWESRRLRRMTAASGEVEPSHVTASTANPYVASHLAGSRGHDVGGSFPRSRRND